VIAIDTKKHDQQESPETTVRPDRDQDQEGDQRDKAADHEDIAMGEIDHADDGRRPWCSRMAIRP